MFEFLMINLCDLFDWLFPSGGVSIRGSVGGSAFRGLKRHTLRVRALVPNRICLLRLVRSRRLTISQRIILVYPV